jgi:hypothetical protein
MARPTKNLRPYVVRAKIEKQSVLDGNDRSRTGYSVGEDHTPPGWAPAHLRHRPPSANELLLAVDRLVLPNAKAKADREKKRKIVPEDAKPNLGVSKRKTRAKPIIGGMPPRARAKEALRQLEIKLSLDPSRE